MSAAHKWFAETSRRERALIRVKNDRLVNDIGTLAASVCRKYPVASVIAATTVGVVVANAAAKRSVSAREMPTPRQSMITSSLKGAVQAYLLHIFTASLKKEPSQPV